MCGGGGGGGELDMWDAGNRLIVHRNHFPSLQVGRGINK